jgi:hypothetical protein
LTVDWLRDQVQAECANSFVLGRVRWVFDGDSGQAPVLDHPKQEVNSLGRSLDDNDLGGIRYYSSRSAQSICQDLTK